MLSHTNSKIGETGLVFAKNNITNQVETIVSVANIQVGTSNQPADLSLNGSIGLSTMDLTLAAGSSAAIANNITNINVLTTGASGTVTLSLPSQPRKGQLIYIKDASGTAETISITIQGAPSGTPYATGIISHLIDRASTKTITTNFGAIQLLWSGNGWHTISNIASSIVRSGGSGDGDVDGPSSSTDNAVARFNGGTGKLIQSSGVTISDTSDIVTSGDVAVNGGNITSTAMNFNLINTNTRILNIGGAAHTINLGDPADAKAIIGDAQIGTLPGFPGDYMMLGHKSLNHVFGNYAVAQGNDGTTWLSAPDDKYVRFVAQGNPFPIGYIGYSATWNQSVIVLDGRVGTKTATILGNTYGASVTTIHAGTGGVTLNGNGATTTITGHTSGNAELYAGSAEIGTWPSNSAFAMFGHSNLNHYSTDDYYALLQKSDGNTYLNCAPGADLYLRYANNTTSRIHIDGTGIGFFGVNPVTRQTGGAVSADATYSATEQNMINTMWTALRNYGLLT